ncbi:MAG: class I SAM-dependent methyltransferase, partial [Candidatus Eremiobacteraeota bacterium]|nr:class I SAM-dependent methyltransferase [Candidatus Eremiobacteraeota bacterium]
GTGEITLRLAELRPDATVLGVDIIDSHLELARARARRVSPRVSFAHQSIYELPADENSFDLVVCRHVLHSIPHPGAVIRELARVTRPGGYLHLIPEDYGMLHFQRGSILDPADFWHVAPRRFGAATNTDLFIGRNTYGIMRDLSFEDVAVDYVVVDSVRAREDFAAILEAWRDGYVESIGELTPISRESALAYFDQMIANVRDPHGYAVWMVPVISGRKPTA